MDKRSNICRKSEETEKEIVVDISRLYRDKNIYDIYIYKFLKENKFTEEELIELLKVSDELRIKAEEYDAKQKRNDDRGDNK